MLPTEWISNVHLHFVRGKNRWNSIFQQYSRCIAAYNIFRIEMKLTDPEPIITVLEMLIWSNIFDPFCSKCCIMNCMRYTEMQKKFQTFCDTAKMTTKIVRLEQKQYLNNKTFLPFGGIPWRYSQCSIEQYRILGFLLDFVTYTFDFESMSWTCRKKNITSEQEQMFLWL